MRGIEWASVLFVATVWTATSVDAGEGGGRHRRDVPHIVMSTDVAIGLIDTHGGASLTPTNRKTPNSAGELDFRFSPWYDRDVTPQDIDDGLTIAMALNLDQASKIELLGIAPTYGNATLAPQMQVARWITRVLKRSRHTPIEPGAAGPASQVQHPIPTWFDQSQVVVDGPSGSFAAACRNEAVRLMTERIRASRRPVTVLGIGPLTDVACLLQTAPRKVLRNVEEVILLASQVEGKSLTILNPDIPRELVVNDFNVSVDPAGAALLLGARRADHVPIRLMTFALTGQTSQPGPDLIPFPGEGDDAFPGPSRATPRNEASFQWLKEASAPRNEFWEGIFGQPEGPFDQYALAAAVWPELFECEPGFAYVQQCPTPQWASADELEHPYNDDNNPCVDHGPENGASLAWVSAQLVVTDHDSGGPLVRGEGSVPPALANQPARRVTFCSDFAGSADDFRAKLHEWVW